MVFTIVFFARALPVLLQRFVYPLLTPLVRLISARRASIFFRMFFAFAPHFIRPWIGFPCLFAQRVSP